MYIDPIKILKRAWQILWSYRALWVFGVILALTASNGFQGNSRWNADSGRDRSGDQGRAPIPPGEAFSQGMDELRQWLDEGMPPLDLQPNELTALIWIGVALLVGLLVLGIVMTVLRYVAETALIRMVDEHEQSGARPGVRQGFRYGWSRTSWRLFVIAFLLGLPIFLLVLLILLAGVGVFVVFIQGLPGLTVPAIVAGIGLFFMLIFLIAILGALLNVLQHFIWRACALEGLGVVESFRQGFSLVRRHWKNVGLMWLVMIGMGIGWAIAMILAFFLTLPLMIITGVAGIIVGGLPTLIVAGISSLFIDGYVPWIIGAVVGLPLFFLVTFSPLVFLSGLQMTFSSTVWTLTYRELPALEASLASHATQDSAPPEEPAPPA